VRYHDPVLIRKSQTDLDLKIDLRYFRNIFFIGILIVNAISKSLIDFDLEIADRF